MIAFPVLLKNVLMFTMLIIPGYVLGRMRKIEKSSIVSFTNILMYVAMPFLVLAKLIETDLSSLSLVGVVAALTVPFVVIFSTFFLSRLFFRTEESRRRYPAERFSSVMANCGFLGIPLAAALFPDNPEVVVYVSLYNVVNTFLLLTFGVYILSGSRETVSVKGALVSPIAAAILLGVLFSLFGVGEAIPELSTYSTTLAALTTPLSMTVLGVQLSGIGFKRIFLTGALYRVVFLKLILAPLIAMLLLFTVSVLLSVLVPISCLAAVFLSTAVSTAASTPAMSDKYGVDGEHAAVLTLGTTLFCTATLPLMYLLFERLFASLL